MKLIGKINNDLIYIYDQKEILKEYKMWSKNRPVDIERIKEISDEIKKTKKVEGIIYFGLIPKEGWVCYDGNNRINALRFNSEKIEVIVIRTEFRDEKEMIERYISINKAMPIPELYKNETNNTNTNQKEKIEKIVEYINRNYIMFKSSSNNPNRPNYNISNLTNNITDYIKENPEETIEEIKKNINFTNEMNKKRIFNLKLSKNIINKCETYNCYLFIYKTLNIQSKPKLKQINLIDL